MFTFLHLLQTLRAMFAPIEENDDAYLAQAVDACDLEFRLRNLDERGRDPYSGIAVGLYPR